MANRFWVGDTGNWSDYTNHWSATTGGAPGASKPGQADNVYFDASSFSAADQTVTINETASCLSMNWTGATNSPTLAGSAALGVFNSLFFITDMVISYTGGLSFFRTTSYQVTTAGHSLLSGITFQGGGACSLNDDFITAGTISLASPLVTNNHNITCRAFAKTNTAAMTWGTSTLTLTGNTVTFAGNGRTYGKVEFQGTPVTITGSNTFNDLKLTAGKTVKFTAGTTQTVTTLSGDGTVGNLVTIQSVTAGTPFTISKSSGTVIKDYYSIKDSTVSGGATFYALDSTDVSGNTGWLWALPDELVSKDVVTDVPTVSKSTLAQVHALTSKAVTTEVPTASKSSIAQTQVLASKNAITSAPTVSKSIMAQLHTLVSKVVTSGAPTISKSALAQLHALVSKNAITSAPTVDKPTITQLHALTSNDVATGVPSVSKSVIEQIHALVSKDVIAGIPEVSKPTLEVIVSAVNLTSKDVSAGVPTVSKSALAQTHALTSQNVIAGAPEVSKPSLSQVHTLASKLVEAGVPTVTALAIAQTHVLVSRDVTTGAVSVSLPDLVSIDYTEIKEIIVKAALQALFTVEMPLTGTFAVQIPLAALFSVDMPTSAPFTVESPQEVTMTLYKELSK